MFGKTKNTTHDTMVDMSNNDNVNENKKYLKLGDTVYTENDVEAMSYIEIRKLVSDIVHEENCVQNKRDNYETKNYDIAGTPDFEKKMKTYSFILRTFQDCKAWIKVIEYKKGNEELNHMRACTKFYEAALKVLSDKDIAKIQKEMNKE